MAIGFDKSLIKNNKFYLFYFLFAVKNNVIEKRRHVYFTYYLSNNKKNPINVFYL